MLLHALSGSDVFWIKNEDVTSRLCVEAVAIAKNPGDRQEGMRLRSMFVRWFAISRETVQAMRRCRAISQMEEVCSLGAIFRGSLGTGAILVYHMTLLRMGIRGEHMEARRWVPSMSGDEDGIFPDKRAKAVGCQEKRTLVDGVREHCSFQVKMLRRLLRMSDIQMKLERCSRRCCWVISREK